MNVDFLIQTLNNKLVILNNAKIQAFNNGDIEHMNILDKDIFETQSTISKLQLLQNIEAAAVSANTTPSTVVNTAIEALQSQTSTTTSVENPTSPLSQYDISSYATDPLHEIKISDILSTMGPMTSAQEIDTYISEWSIGSPLTGSMILSASSQYSIDTRLLMAIMELDSRFGTAGVAVSTLNPGNVGNTGTETRSYPTWQDGVNAVAEWLNSHRGVTPM